MNLQTTVSPAPLLELDNVSIAYQQGTSSQRVVHKRFFYHSARGSRCPGWGIGNRVKTTTAQAIIGLPGGKWPPGAGGDPA
ncbi:Uncharacterised protein [Serratia fonticola]|uniref:Uncharacterized protein n=1 Tax=Serratia fonticola TaxID=47917 RepID=A0A4U9WN22_SERFO|nr:Uncharacterised protein [Serratia fonticola]